MTKKQLVASVAKRTGCSARFSGAMVDAVFDTIAGELAAGREVKLVGFGKFSVRRFKSKIGRNVRKNTPVVIPERLVPQFSAGKALIDRIEKGEKT